MKVKVKSFNPKFVALLQELGWTPEPICHERGLKEGWTIGLNEKLELNGSMHFVAILGVTDDGRLLLDNWGAELDEDSGSDFFTYDTNIVCKTMNDIVHLTNEFKKGNFMVFYNYYYKLSLRNKFLSLQHGK